MFAYADDLLLASTTMTGLQSLIDLAVFFVTQRGLKFNPSKTTCMVYGKSPFTSPPKWHINDVSLEISNSVKYLGTLLNNTNGKDHTESRIRAANRSFYTLQGAGVCMNGLSPFVSAHVYNIAIRSGLLYGCNSLYLSKSNLLDIDKLQGKLLKAILGLPTRCHTTPILQALGINSCASTVTLSSLDLLKTCLSSSSATASFYKFYCLVKINML